MQKFGKAHWYSSYIQLLSWKLDRWSWAWTKKAWRRRGENFSNQVIYAGYLAGSLEKKILIDRFFMGKTQVEISEEIGISQAQVSRLEKNAISNIKKFIK